MATSLTLENDSSLTQGYLKVNGSTAATLTTTGIISNVTGDVTGNVTGSLAAGGSLTLETAQTASGTAVDFTGIPSWAKRITVMFSGVSTSGTSNPQIQIGTGSIESSGYLGTIGSMNNTGAGGADTFSSGFIVMRATAATAVMHGKFDLVKVDSNVWAFNGGASRSDVIVSMHSSGSKPLSDTLTQVRITTVNGTDTFDAGTINISYEG